jgi:hypothetical protein
VADCPLRSEPTEGALVASYDFSVVAWEVQTTMHFAEKEWTYDPFDVRVIALQDDLGLQLRDSPATVRAEDAVRILPWHVQRPRAYLFENPYQAVAEFFGAVQEASVDAASLFWLEARIPTFGSPPKDWEKLSDLANKVGETGVFGMIVLGLLDEPMTLLLVVGGLLVLVNILNPVTEIIGTGMKESIRRAFDLPGEEAPRRRKRNARGRRAARSEDG